MQQCIAQAYFLLFSKCFIGFGNSINQSFKKSSNVHKKVCCILLIHTNLMFFLKKKWLNRHHNHGKIGFQKGQSFLNVLNKGLIIIILPRLVFLGTQPSTSMLVVAFWTNFAHSVFDCMLLSRSDPWWSVNPSNKALTKRAASPALLILY